MNLNNWLTKWDLSSLKINAHFLEAELQFNDADKKAAWELYVELLTRITTQPLDDYAGNEVSALGSIFSLFSTTRSIIKGYGPSCIGFTKIAIVILNQKIRPFTSKWHKLNSEDCFKNEEYRIQFRTELELVQQILQKYSHLLSEMAGVEDLTDLEYE